MIDWSNYNSLPTEETIDRYPTILDILKDVVGQSEEEQIMKNPFDRERGDFFYDWTRKGHYLMIRDDSLGMNLFTPTSRTPMTYYRGQSHYYDKCVPSLFRFSGKELEREELRSFLQTAEMMLVMGTHPVIKDLQSGTLVSDRIGPVPLTIMYDGLAQHYGIKTCYLDFTNDIWAASFFASTLFRNGRYEPFVVSETTKFENRFGVLYKIDYQSSDKFQSIKNSEIKPIGLQYFNRPGRQNGFVRSMYKERDLHQLPDLERIYFRHDNEVSNLIFTLSQWGRQYLPDDSFADIVNTICKTNKVCKKSVELAKEIYLKEKTLLEFTNDVMSAGFEITQELNASFPAGLLEQEWRDWMCGGRERYINDILIVPVQYLNLDK